MNIIEKSLKTTLHDNLPTKSKDVIFSGFLGAVSSLSVNVIIAGSKYKSKSHKCN